MRTRATWKFVAKATALGARVPQAELFVLDFCSSSSAFLNLNCYTMRRNSNESNFAGGYS